MYVYRSAGSLWQAGFLLVAAVLLALLLPDVGLRLLAGLFALPPLIWGSYELARRRSGLLLEDDALTLRQPLGLRSRRVPYVQIVGLAAWPQAASMSLGVAYAEPRPPFEGEPDPRPPRVHVIATLPLANFPAALADLRGRIERYRSSDPIVPWLSDDDLRHRLRARRFRRAALGTAAFLSTPLLVIVTVRLSVLLLRVLAALLPR